MSRLADKPTNRAFNWPKIFFNTASKSKDRAQGGQEPNRAASYAESFARIKAGPENDAILAMLRREREEIIASAKKAGLIE